MTSTLKAGYQAQKYMKKAKNSVTLMGENMGRGKSSNNDNGELKTPLLDDDTQISEVYDKDGDTDENNKSPKTVNGLKTSEWFKLVLVCGISATGFVSCMFAVGVTAEAAVCIVLASFTGVMAPVAIYNQTQLALGETKRFYIQMLQKEANRLGKANDELSGEVDKLEGKSKDLKDVSTKLDKITRRQGRTVNAFVEMVKTNGSTLKTMRKNVSLRLQQILIRIVLSCDKNKDFIIDDGEIGELIIRLEHIDGVILDPRKFRYDVSRDPRVGNVLALVKDSIGGNSTSTKENVYTISEGSRKNLRLAVHDDSLLGQALKF
eukprot:CAMPEP_0194371832 /NCGR_PEP_ID=MMETSP0174-20130528/20213_1 /TAXON_ID=216777 /ORGANISM="Proboscia alata, Strain PI-D3" /LENGTH=319 /DNA_ID=CAMNT_0039150067 /DNA_START=66 /DNA_END=1025 /DNA_ORIENTATION=+